MKSSKPSYERNLSNCVEKPEVISSIDSFITGTLEPTNDQLPASVTS